MENGQIVEMARLSRMGTARAMDVDMEIVMAGHVDYLKMLGTGTGAYAHGSLLDLTNTYKPYEGLTDKQLSRKIDKQGQ